MTRTATLSPEAADVLARSTVTEGQVRLPDEQLPRPVYVEVDKFFKALGGRWNRAAQAHVFTRDPREAMAAALAAGEQPVNEDKELSYWPTPPAVAELAVAPLVGLRRGVPIHVLEPSAGDGALVSAIRGVRPDASLTCVEVDEVRAGRTARLFGGDRCATYAMSFEDFAARGVLAPFDAVVMNPPFTLPGRPRAWVEHLMLAWELLGAGGVLSAIVPASLGFDRPVRVIREAREVILSAGGGWSTLPDDAFRAVGTGVRTLLVSAVKPG